MNALFERMRLVREAAYFTVSDMAVWFGVNRTNMDQWITQAHEPRPHTQRQLLPLIVLLENVLLHADTKQFLPVPLEIKQHERAAYIRKVKAHAVTQFAAPDTAGTGNKMLGEN